jgi:hypothetical protein
VGHARGKPKEQVELTSASQLMSTSITESRTRMFAPTPISLIGLVDTAHDGHALRWSNFCNSAGG